MECISYLKVLPDISHRALNEDVARFFLQWLPLAVQLVNGVQVVHAANFLPLVALKVCDLFVHLYQQ